MSVFSTRYQWPLAGILAVGAFALVASSIRPNRTDDCANPRAMLDLEQIGWAGTVTNPPDRLLSGHVQWSEGLMGSHSAPPQSELQPRKAQSRRQSRQWWTRESRDVDSGTLNVRVVRSFNPFYVRQRATSILGIALVPDESLVRRVSTPFGDLDLHVVRKYAGERSQVVVYAYIFEGRSVETPLLAEVAALPTTLLHGAKPLTLLIVHATREHGSLGTAEDEAIAWIEAAWGYYQDVCVADPRERR